MSDYSFNSDSGNCEKAVAGSMASGVAFGLIGGSVGTGSLMFLGFHLYQKKKKKENSIPEKSDRNKTTEDKVFQS